MVQQTTPLNRFKQRLQAGDRLIGLWSTLGDATVAELLSGCGYDWVLIDAEHGPNDLRSVLAQVRALAAGERFLGVGFGELSQAVVRLPEASATLIKQYLEIGVRNLLVPMVNSVEEAEAVAAAVRYPPRGVRGMGSGLARSSGWGRLTDYLAAADDDVCVIVQAETRRAVDALAQITAVDGVDGVLFGPADLAADLGHPGQRNHPDVVAAITRGIAAVTAAGKPAGIMLSDVAQAKDWLGRGITFAGVGVDSSLLVTAAETLLAQFQDDLTVTDAGY
ncbi:HpcH/HpaI aldolase family protein [Nocardioides sp. Iso805N]|uniref:HpcH/HpaI aldolase family protein n=1 Tax=Nocardioides sp. Iso805N TaxID=1283287 RepID=UPI0003A6A05D|nr:HpcH/HpaI aldolase/citrate lyase family protein [Nocardioides sp. Iso805N]